MADDKKNPKEASNIFHSIMKASVSKKQVLDETDKILEETKKKLNDAKANLEAQKKSKEKGDK